MLDENTHNHWAKIGLIALTTFLASFLAFYIVMNIMVNRITNPAYEMKHLEKMIQSQEKDLQKYNEKLMLENPFEPRMRPMIVNLVKEPSEYKVIINLADLDDNEKLVNVNIKDNELTVSGEIDKKVRGTERMINFTQTYYLDEKIQEDKISKERKGNKYIVTIPFED